MAQPLLWYEGNDMIAALTGLKSSTMGSTAYLNSSTNLKVTLYDGPTTSATAIISNRVLAYTTGTNGNYRTVIQSTESTALQRGDEGLAVFVLNHSGLNGKWWLNFATHLRRTT